MSQAQVVRLFRDSKVNPVLKDRLNACISPEQFVQLAQHHGYDFTLEEWQASTRFSVEELKCELSEIPGI